MNTLIEYEPATGKLIAPVGRTPRPRTAPPVAPVQAPPAARVQQVVRAVLEVLNGRRPIGQLRELLTDRAYAAVLHTPSARRGTVLRLRALRTSRPTPDSMEVAATVLAGRRVRAAAARLEWHQETWLCTDFGLL